MNTQNNTLTKDEAIAEMLKGKKVTHPYFSDTEWCKLNGYYEIEFEDGCKIDVDTFWRDRPSEAWSTGWSIWEEATPSTPVAVEDIKESEREDNEMRRAYQIADQQDWEAKTGSYAPVEDKHTESNKQPLYKQLYAIRQGEGLAAEVAKWQYKTLSENHFYILAEALEKALERMERARGILKREGANWGMLDTSDLKPALNNIS